MHNPATKCRSTGVFTCNLAILSALSQKSTLHLVRKSREEHMEFVRNQTQHVHGKDK
jgi:hypothetical protein